MKDVNVEFSGNGTLLIDTFENGFTGNISVDFNATCCTRAATLNMVDMSDNSMSRKFDQGSLRG